MKYVGVAIDNNTDQTDQLYTYRAEDDRISVGSKVRVPFAQGNRMKDAYVFQVSHEPPEGVSRFKDVSELDEAVSLNEEMMQTCSWMRGRYLCRYIDGINCFTPVGGASKRGVRKNPFADLERGSSVAPVLNPEQEAAMNRLRPAIRKSQHQVILVHGVTGSGKTELYLQSIGECVAAGKTAVMLVPEISLTLQTVQRFIDRFGHEAVAVLHSRLTAGQRYDEWMRIRTGKVSVVIGARSAVFAPLERIGIIILDEEHETSYKSDMTPKYDTLEVAVRRAMLHQAVVLLGSATPSMQSMYRAEQGQFQYIALKERYNRIPLPKVELVDMREELKLGNRSIFSQELYEKMRQCLEEKKQIILFLNRRGYSTFISCRECGYVLRCEECGISMPYHKAENMAVCHFCGRKAPVPDLCPSCGSRYIRQFGAGTEKVIETVYSMFPDAVAERLDLDTTKKKGSLDQILKNFRKGKTDILVGTQMVAKGLDFANVGLVGVISADVSLNIPDYRSSERTFQLITQAAGRAGRGDEEGHVVVQSYSPEHYAIMAASRHDYREFYDKEIQLRRQIGYPPFSDFFQMIISDESESAAKDMAEQISRYLKEHIGRDDGVMVMNPQQAPLNKISSRYRYQLLIRVKSGKRRQYAQELSEMKQRFFVQNKTSCLLSADINPYSFL